MNESNQMLWQRFQKFYLDLPRLGVALDLSRMRFEGDFFARMELRMQKAYEAMTELENGAIANPDEKRMVGHYWLRNPALAPTQEIRQEIEAALAAVKSFAAEVHSGKIQGAAGSFKNVLLIGIGGSALGPQFVSNALGQPGHDQVAMFFLDNTDPDGMDRVFAQVRSELGRTLCIVISKSGGTKETRNGMLEAEAAYRDAGLDFGKHTVAVTSRNSDLDKYAAKHGWLSAFPMWDWVGGRTSELSAVGLLPAALQGFDIESMLEGARVCDELTRNRVTCENPAALMALTWYHSGGGKGTRNLIILPYKDRLELFSKYLQQLIMESLGKEKDRDGNVVNQGLTVLGNKGSTDQHSYIQQLRDGLSNFFVTFIEVLRDRAGSSIEVEPKVTTGDYLSGFYQGTRRALYESGRESLTLTITEVTPFITGALIALFERTVGLYATLININAYHQPGVEAGKKAAGTVIDLQIKVIDHVSASGTDLTVEEIAEGIGAQEEVETVYKICEHLAANPGRAIRKLAGKTPFQARYRKG